MLHAPSGFKIPATGFARNVNYPRVSVAVDSTMSKKSSSVPIVLQEKEKMIKYMNGRLDVAPVVYLAGGVEHAKDSGRTWRNEVTPTLMAKGFQVWNPVEHQKEVAGYSPEEVRELKNGNFSEYAKAARKVVEVDLKKVSECELIVCKIDESALAGAGTFGELTFARAAGIPVFAWIDLPEGIKQLPSWVVGCLDWCTNSKQELLHKIPRARTLREQQEEKLAQHMNEYIEEWSKEFSDR